MDNSDQTRRPVPTSHGRIPAGAVAAALHSQVAAVLRVLESARREAELRPPVAPVRLIDRYRDPLQATMLALGETLAGFLEESVQPVDFEALRAGILEPILALFRSLPLHRRSEEWVRHKDQGPEMYRLVLEGRPIGFDLPSMLLDDFLQNAPGSRSFRSRAAALVSLFHVEAGNHRRRGVKAVRVLVLGADSILSLDTPFLGKVSTAPISMLVIDGDTQNLRRARQRVEESFDVRPEILRATPEAFAKNPGRDTQLFDMAFTLTQYDSLAPEAALGFTRGLAALLKPGGALLTGCHLPGLPRAIRALALAFVGMEWQYWDETMWREMLSQLPFDLSASRFDILQPYSLVVTARRSSLEMFE